ncbi:DUF222 domain-containing protein [Saxibacter everestensis]|uniref:DUF222 domain-containing protein n=1 Tax=Saxibacter everestensis TaxID=2909229 RepID=A0ABY8QV70_9MICO|nr:DUF222 domain-containing protein [Brevibacteriaceae bacterium ZFBP1038]
MEGKSRVARPVDGPQLLIEQAVDQAVSGTVSAESLRLLRSVLDRSLACDFGEYVVLLERLDEAEELPEELRVDVIRAWERVSASARARQDDQLAEHRANAAAAAARVYRAQAAGSTRPGVDELERFARMEVTAALKWTDGHAKRRIDQASRVIDRLPSTHVLHRAAALSSSQVAVLDENSKDFDAYQAAAFEMWLLPKIPELTVARTRRLAARYCANLCPEILSDRLEQALQRRCVKKQACPDGMAILEAYLPADAAEIVYNCLTTFAHTGPPETTVSQRRADALVDLALAGLAGYTDPAGRALTTTLNVTIPATLLAQTLDDLAAREGGDRTGVGSGGAGSGDDQTGTVGGRPDDGMTGSGNDAHSTAGGATASGSAAGASGTSSSSSDVPRGDFAGADASRNATATGPPTEARPASDEEPAGAAILAGYGVIPPTLAVRLAADATWRRIITDPINGTVLHIDSNEYRPPEELKRYVVARSQHCIFIGCTVPAHKCDLDHTVPFPVGRTTAANMGPLSRGHHRLKTFGQWKLEQPENGVFRWTDPHHRQYWVTPEPLESEPLHDLNLALPDTPPF